MGRREDTLSLSSKPLWKALCVAKDLALFVCGVEEANKLIVTGRQLEVSEMVSHHLEHD